jgi:tetratricopeptide (TPR) repeat protein
LIYESGLSYAALAQAVNHLGHLAGKALNYHKSAVSRWISGEQPRKPAPELILEVLRRKLNRDLTYRDLGFDIADLDIETRSLWYADLDTTLDVVPSLWSHDVFRRNLLKSSAVAVGAMTAPARTFIFFEPDERVSHRGSTQVGLDDVKMISEVAYQYWRWDSKYGGGRFREQLIYFLHSHVAPLLGGRYGDEVGRNLLSAAGEATMLAGWMAYDTASLGLAQRYYTQALRMAQAAGDRQLGGEILTCMAYVADSAGAPDDAIRLCDYALNVTKGRVSPRVLSYVYSVMSRCLASAPDAFRDRPAALTALGAAERHFARPLDGTENPWVAGIDFCGLQTQAAHILSELGIIGRAHEAVSTALGGRDESHRRAVAFCKIYLGMLHVKEDDAEAAVATGNEVLSLLPGLETARVRQGLRRLQREINSLGNTEQIRTFNERARGILI